MNINEIINEYGKYNPTHNQGLTNHLPMAQLALFRMGSGEERIRRYSDFYVSDKNLEVASPSTIEIKNILDELGNRDVYLSYYDYYLERVSNEEIGFVVREVLNSLSKGLASGLFHGIIRLAYALEEDNKEEICRALAFYSSIYKETRFTNRIIPKENINEELLNVVLRNSEDNFYLDGDIDEKEGVLLQSLVELYFSTGAFVVLHTITGFHALLELKPLYDNYNEVFDRFTVCIQRALLHVSDDSFRKVVLTKKHETWKELFVLACSTDDSHTFKFIYSCFRLNQIFNYDGLMNVANIKLKLDHNL